MVQDSVSNPMIGKMRMQFWRDAVKGISDVRTSYEDYVSDVHNFRRRADRHTIQSRWRYMRRRGRLILHRII